MEIDQWDVVDEAGEVLMENHSYSECQDYIRETAQTVVRYDMPFKTIVVKMRAYNIVGRYINSMSRMWPD